MTATRLFLASLITTGLSLSGYSQATMDSVAQNIAASGETPMALKLVAGSRLWIEGSTTLAGFDCEATEVNVRSAEATSTSVKASLDVPVRSLECGRDRMNHDLRKAMKADEHPDISFRLSEASGTSGSFSTESGMDVAAVGFLTVAGVERKVAVQATAQETDDGSFRVSGHLPIQMTDYSITPPRALRGLIRVRDEIVVQFDLIVAAASTKN